jgi:shikimate kinase
VIFLTGLMGSGKTTVGRLLARRLGWRFMDTDALVERRAKKSVAAIFAGRGEAHFRRLESEALESLAGKKRLVVATGGGLVLKASNRAWMRAHGLVLHLAVPVSVLAKRLDAAQSATRPLLQKNRLAELAKKRARFYGMAPITVKAGGSPRQVCAGILLQIRKKAPGLLADKTPH